MNPQAAELNEIIVKSNPEILELLSERGKNIFFPKKGILGQTADAKTAQRASEAIMSDIDELTQRVANHLAGREVILRWQNPPSSSAVGQVVKTASGQVVIYVGDLTSVKTRFEVLVHELAHVALDYSWLPVSTDHKLAPGSIRRTQSERDAWRSNPHEVAAKNLTDKWLEHADKHAPDYWRAGRSALECKLLALLNY